MRTEHPLQGHASRLRHASASSGGFTLVDIVVAIAVLGIVGAVSLPLLQVSVGRLRTSGAAAYLSSRIARTRFEAVRRATVVALRFTQTPDGYSYQAFVDGNNNGVLTNDILRGIDRPISPLESLDHHFAGVMFGIHQGVTGLDPGQPFDPADPIQIGNSTLVSFSPDGSCTAGTLFLRGERRNQFAVRVLGTTGRARVFEFDFASRTWRNH